MSIEDHVSRRGEVLVGILNDQADLTIAHEQHWYRIPVNSVARFLKDCWPPQWIAFYQTKTFGVEAFSVNYYARVLDVRQVFRSQLFPSEPKDDNGLRRYYQLMLSPLQKLKRPILSRRLRRIVFIPTTLDRLASATEMNDLYHESPLEDRLWSAFKQLHIDAERQEFLQIGEGS